MKVPAYNYIHPEDNAALENLKNITMFTTAYTYGDSKVFLTITSGLRRRRYIPRLEILS